MPRIMSLICSVAFEFFMYNSYLVISVLNAPQAAIVMMSLICMYGLSQISLCLSHLKGSGYHRVEV